MAITFPTTLDVLANPTAANYTTVVPHATQHADANDAIEALEAKVGINDSAVKTSIDSKLQAKPTSTLVSVASKGGVIRNIDGAVGDVAVTSDNWIEGEQFGWFCDSGATNISAEFNTTLIPGEKVIKLSTTNTTGKLSVGNLPNPNTLAEKTKWGIRIKPSTKYVFRCEVNTYNVAANAVYLSAIQYDIAGVIGTNSNSEKLTGTNGKWQWLSLTFTSDADAEFLWILLYNVIAGNVGYAAFRNKTMTLEEVKEDTTSISIPTKISTSLQANTSTDNIDQSLDPAGAYANTYALTNAVNEGATHIQTFTPTKKKVNAIAVYVVDKGSGNWTLVVHNSANVFQFSTTIANASLINGAFNYFGVPFAWLTGAYHFHVYSSVADGTLKANTSNDLETGSFIQTYDKLSEGMNLVLNGIPTKLIGDKDGLLSNAIWDLNKGKYKYDVYGVLANNYKEIYKDLYSYVGAWNALGVSLAGAGNQVVYKINTILPFKNLKINAYLHGAATRFVEILVSLDNIVYTSLGIQETASHFLTGDFLSNLTGNIVYVKVAYSSGGASYAEGLKIEADLDTSKIPQGLIYPLAVNQFSEQWASNTTALSIVYRKEKYTNKNGVVMPALELNNSATGAGNAVATILFPIDNSQETTPSVKILSASGIASDTVLDTDGEYVALSAGATVGKITYQIGQGAACDPITKNVLYLSSNSESVDSTQDPSHQMTVNYTIKNQGAVENTRDLLSETQDIKKGIADTQQLVRNNSLITGFDSGTTDAYEITIPDFQGYKVGMSVLFKANTVNTGACTLNINGMGAKAIVKGITTALSDADILALMWCQLIYDGTAFVLLNPRVL